MEQAPGLGQGAAAPAAEQASPQQPAALTPPGTARDYRPGTTIHPPSGIKARARANLAAIATVARVEGEDRVATAAEQDVLARWSGWGAVPQIFDTTKDEWAAENAELRAVLSEADYRSARTNTLNAHYTDPEVAAALWTAVRDAGFAGGRVLEPGSGAGTFIGLAPADAVMVGVELDPTTAKISSLLYPGAQIRNEGFEATRVPENSFVAAIGNVPFGGFALHDPAHNPAGHNIHNHFILKSLALTAPGGYVATISSHFTLDAGKQRARRDIADVADLVGAVRLPTKAFDRVAGTAVVTDIVILRKREEGQAPAAGQDWIDTSAVDVLDEAGGRYVEHQVNNYFVAHPDNVLGELRSGHGMHNANTLEVRNTTGGGALAEQVRDRLAAVTTGAVAQGLALTATAETTTTLDPAAFDRGLVTAATMRRGVPEGTLRYDTESAGIQRWDGQVWAGHSAGRAKTAEWRAMLAMRDLSNTLIRAQRDGLPAGDRDQLRGELNRVYDAYVATHGPINRFTWTNPADITQPKHDERVAKDEAKWRKRNGADGGAYGGPVPVETREEWEEKAWEPTARSKRTSHLYGGMLEDPGYAVVAALEIFDDETMTARKAPIFATDVLGPRQGRDSADSVEEAIGISLDETRTVDVARVGALVGLGEADTREAMAGRVFPNPDGGGELIPAATYLSGNVRRKLTAARAAAEADPGYAGNVAALAGVQPRTIEAPEIHVRPGVPWITAEDHADFVREVFGVGRAAADYTLGQWTIKAGGDGADGHLMTDTYGTVHRTAAELLESVCNAKTIQIARPKAEVERTGGDPTDLPATFAAQEKARKITDKFTEWLWTDPDRTARLVTEYNERFNSLRATVYDGMYLELPGLGLHFTPHPYQRNAVARILSEPTVLLDHVVGAGKTGTMFMAAMELKRLGLAKQPWIVVPNHLIEQVGREAKQWYPGSNVLVGSGATDAKGRRLFVAQSATSDWDMVIVPKSVFTAIGVSPQRKAAHHQVLRDELAQAKAEAPNRDSVKVIEAALLKLDKRIEALTEQTRKDTGLCWEDTACDYLQVDEAHMYKNRQRVSAVRELACTDGSTQAEDLAMKLEHLREFRRGRDVAEGRPPGPERVATFATGTPVSNSLGEMWVMQSFLRPDLLEDAGVSGIDAWGAVFTGTATTVEMNATGSKLAPVTRVSRFQNVPELVSMSSVYTDVVLREEVARHGRIPELSGGQRGVVSKQPSQDTRDFIADLAWRSTNFDRKRPDFDNALKVSNDGRNVSMDERLANLDEPLDGGRVQQVAAQVDRIWTQTRDRVFYDTDGAPEPEPGGLQIVFCDRSTPHQKDGKWSIYEGLRDELVAQGMPAGAIRFIHDYPKPNDKAQLFADCRNGRVAVIMGSTEKMGTGTNIQDRAVALHHMDVPWRPSDLEQREGRIIRQGNKNPSVEILNYVTEGTFDTIMWQTVEKKARFIAQLKTGNTDARTAEDIGGGMENAAAATKAVSTGDPRYVEQVQLADDVARLAAMQRAHSDSQGRNAAERRMLSRDVSAVREQIGELDTAAPRITASADAAFSMSIRGRTYTERAAAAPALVASLRQAYADGKGKGAQAQFPVASLRGVEVRASRMLQTDELMLALDVPGRTRALQTSNLAASGAAGVGLVARVENMVTDTTRYQAELDDRLGYAQSRIAELEKVADEPFAQAGELKDKRSQLETLSAQLSLDANSPEALAKEEADRQRLALAGRKPGWSLALNPTPALLADRGPEALSLHAGRGFAAPAGAQSHLDGAAARQADGHTALTAGQERAAPHDAPAEHLTEEQRNIENVMAGRRTKTIRQIVDNAANGGGAAARDSAAAQRDRHRGGPSRGR